MEREREKGRMVLWREREMEIDTPNRIELR